MWVLLYWLKKCKGLEIIFASILTNYPPFIVCTAIFFYPPLILPQQLHALLLGLCWHSPLCSFQTKLFWQAGQSVVAKIPFPPFTAGIRIQHPRVLGSCARACRETLNCRSGQAQPREPVPQQHPCHKCAQLSFLCWLWRWLVEFLLWLTCLLGFSSEFRVIILIVTF